jgi:ferredoxin
MLDELAALHGDISDNGDKSNNDGRLKVYVSDEGRRNDLAVLLATPEPGTQIYACGPARMLSALESLGAAWPEDALHVEHFETTRRTLDPAHEQAFDVELKDSGIVVRVGADQTVLNALRAANIDVQSDCEEGLCGSCEVHVLAGQIDHRDLVLTRAEREAGAKMMVCCSRARKGGGKLVLEL